MDDNMKSGQPVVETTEDDLPPVRSGAITLTSQGVSWFAFPLFLSHSDAVKTRKFKRRFGTHRIQIRGPIYKLFEYLFIKTYILRTKDICLIEKHLKIIIFWGLYILCLPPFNSNFLGVQWLSGRVLNSRPWGRGFEPHQCHSVVVLEQDTFILA